MHFPRHSHPIALSSKELGFISTLVPFSALMISVVLVTLFLIRYYILEAFLIRRLYGSAYTELSERNRRGFINHHISGITKVLILIVAAYPFISVAFCAGTSFQTPFVHGSKVKLGDILVVAAQMLIGMYIFELIYRVKLSPVAVMHHIGTIFIGQTAIAISLRPLREPDAYIEFVLCTVWGAFDIISEFFPHVAIILYRVFPKRHHFLSNVFLVSCFTTATGTFLETLVTMWLFGSLWKRWRLAFKVITPILHVAFSAAQIHGSYVFWQMYRRQRSLIGEANTEARDRDFLHGGEGTMNDHQTISQSVTLVDQNVSLSLGTMEFGFPIAPISGSIALASAEPNRIPK